MIILLDDVGYGQLSAFGGPYRVPNIERLADRGLRYTNFHTTALCSPTRAALLTGRNHHSVGMATITETASDEPGYNGHIPASAGTLAAMLQANGYAAYALGKWHLTPQPDSGPEGPFDHWPTRMGFDHWYGFQGADTDQWAPGLWDDTTPVEPPHDGSYHLTTDIADRAVRFLNDRAGSDQPFFLYFATGAGHAPHQVPAEWIERNRGRFDEGWDVARERIFAKQKELGVVPADAVLPPRSPDIAARDSLDEQHRRLYTRMQEIHAGFIEHTDHEIGRVLDALQASGKLDDTLIIFTADNGTSGEGGLDGSINEFRIGGDEPTFAEIYARIDDLGGPSTYNHYPAGWAQAGNTPFRYWKQEAHEGGVRDPMIVSWPARITDHGGIRNQFEHVIDVTPTVLQAVGLEAPATLDGVTQMPIQGTAFNATFAGDDVPTAKTVQYFEMLGNRGIWSDGWKAVAFHGRLPWMQGVLTLQPFEDDRWELYNVRVDPTESHDLSAQEPERLRQLKELFDQQARLYQVYPLDGSGLRERAAALQSSLTLSVNAASYPTEVVRIPESKAPWLKGRSHEITADIDLTAAGGNGVIVAHGGRFGGYSLYLKDGRLAYSYNYVGQSVQTIEASTPLPAGRSTVRFEFTQTPDAEGSPGVGRLLVNGVQVAEGGIARTSLGPFGFSDTFDVGSDTVTSVAPDVYQAPNAFPGTVSNVRFEMADAMPIE
jgi:arylsulfatase